jgi:hypothetical protein
MTGTKKAGVLNYILSPESTNYNISPLITLDFTCVRKGRSGPSSSVGITTGYGLDGPGIESREGEIFSAPVHTGPEVHPAFCTMGTGSFPGVKNGRGVRLTLYPLLLPLVMKEYSYTSTPPMGRTACTEPQYSYTFTPPMGRTACTEPQ